jgi:hypothetical protein
MSVASLGCFSTVTAAPFVANYRRLVANAFSFESAAVSSLSFVVISCVVWPARCGAGHIICTSDEANRPLA